jgi:hypothetical protein
MKGITKDREARLRELNRRSALKQIWEWIQSDTIDSFRDFEYALELMDSDLTESKEKDKIYVF